MSEAILFIGAMFYGIGIPACLITLLWSGVAFALKGNVRLPVGLSVSFFAISALGIIMFLATFPNLFLAS